MLTTIRKNLIEYKNNPPALPFLFRRKIERLSNLEKYAEIGKLSTGILHDIINPLSSLLLSVTAFHSLKSKADSEKCIQMITQSGRQMEDLLDLIKTYTRSTSMFQKTDLTILINNVMLLMKCHALKNNIQIVFARTENIEVVCDQLSLYQVLINLMSNAIESYRETESKYKKIIIEVSRRIDGVIISVRDYGKGISKVDINRIFTPLYSTRKCDGGSGIGLATVKYAVESKLYGTINVFSEKQNGTIFSIKIPS